MAIWKNPNLPDSPENMHDDMDGAALNSPSWPENQGVALTKLTPEEVAAIRAPTIAQARVTQLSAIAGEFLASSAVPVTDSSGNTWTGGFDSAQNIYGAAQLAQAGGAASVTIFDAHNEGHSLTIAQAIQVAATVGASYQTVFAKYQGLKVQIASAKTVAEVQAITWS